MTEHSENCDATHYVADEQSAPYPCTCGLDAMFAELKLLREVAVRAALVGGIGQDAEYQDMRAALSALDAWRKR